jgi:hypothetical protein
MSIYLMPVKTSIRLQFRALSLFKKISHTGGLGVTTWAIRDLGEGRPVILPTDRLWIVGLAASGAPADRQIHASLDTGSLPEGLYVISHTPSVELVLFLVGLQGWLADWAGWCTSRECRRDRLR